MEKHIIYDFHFARFPISELERLTGLTPVGLRDWRRRGLIHPTMSPKEDGSFHLGTIAELLLLKRLSNHGIGPKQVYGWTSSFGSHVLWHAVNHRDAWANDEAWEVRQREMAKGRHYHPRYMVIHTAPGGIIGTLTLDKAMSPLRDVATIVDLETLGSELRELIGPGVGRVSFEILNLP